MELKPNTPPKINTLKSCTINANCPLPHHWAHMLILGHLHWYMQLGSPTYLLTIHTILKFYYHNNKIQECIPIAVATRRTTKGYEFLWFNYDPKKNSWTPCHLFVKASYITHICVPIKIWTLVTFAYNIQIEHTLVRWNASQLLTINTSNNIIYYSRCIYSQ